MRGVLVLLAGCGRIGFDTAAIGDAPAVDTPAVIDSAPAPAQVCKPSNVMRIANFSSTTAHTWEPALSPDGQTILFARDPDIYRSTRTGATTWKDPERLALGSVGTKRGPAWVSNTRFYFAIDTGADERLAVAELGVTPRISDVPGLGNIQAFGPTVAADELEMFFTSVDSADSPADIRRATRSDTTQDWVLDPQKVLYTPADEGWPSLSSDGLILYFESNYNLTDPGLWYATRADRTSAWGPAQLVSGFHAVGVPDGDPDVSGDTLVFASERGGSTFNEIYIASCR